MVVKKEFKAKALASAPSRNTNCVVGVKMFAGTAVVNVVVIKLAAPNTAVIALVLLGVDHGLASRM